MPFETLSSNIFYLMHSNLNRELIPKPIPAIPFPLHQRHIQKLLGIIDIKLYIIAIFSKYNFN